jgi:uncharacterized protein (TIGR02266 family)
MPTTSSLTEYQTLVAQRKLRALTDDERTKLEFLEDVLLEFGALPTEGDQHPVRTPRVAVKLEVAFASAEAVTKCYAHDIGTGGIAITTDQKLAIGAAISLTVRLPGDDAPLEVSGTVAWQRAGVVGVSFADLAPAEDRRLKAHLLTNDSLLKRVRAAFEKPRAPMPVAAKTVREPAPLATKTPVPLPRPVLVKLLDASLQAVVIEMLTQLGFQAFEARRPAGPTPLIAAIEAGVPDTAMAGYPATVPVVCVNVSGPDALFGWLLSRNALGFVRRRATAAAIVNAIEEALRAA